MEILLLEKNYDICEIKQRNKKSKKSYIWKIWKGKINLHLSYTALYLKIFLIYNLNFFYTYRIILIYFLLENSIFNEILHAERFKEDEISVILKAFPQNPAAAQVASRFVRANWQEIAQRYFGFFCGEIPCKRQNVVTKSLF